MRYLFTINGTNVPKKICPLSILASTCGTTDTLFISRFRIEDC